MNSSFLSFQHVVQKEKCTFCGEKVRKNGKSSEGKQRFYCLSCKKSRVETYTYKAWEPQIIENLVALTKEGVGIRASARLLGIAQSTVIRKIKKKASEIKQPAIKMGQTYQLDEMRSFVKKKKTQSGLSMPSTKKPKKS